MLIKKFKLLKKKSILCKKKTKKVSKKKRKTKSRIQRGGNGESLTISYNEKSIVNGSNISDSIDYSKAPQIIINNSDINKTYLITMTDPDAPNGLENKLGNFTYTHLVFTRNGNDNNTYNEIVPYAPPSPPRGTHKYQFNLYDVSQINTDGLKVNNKLDRTKYFITTLQLFIKNNLIKLLFQFQFIVKK
jgi:phosphatidylethanolamine-binding protein (PEBP) family uncharacterized protein